MPQKQSTVDRIIELGNKNGVSIFLDGSKDSDSAKIGTPYTYQAKDKILTLILANLKPTTKEKLMPFLREKWEEFGILLKVTQQQTLESYISYKENQTDQDIIDFYSDKIPSSDLDALKMSFFLRSQKEMNRDINVYKQQIRERFGERGAYISNLCNSGYFEHDFMDFHDKHPEGFDRFYELSVGRELIAIFVHSGLSFSSLCGIIEDKLILVRRFRLNSFKIHGFGSWNVDLIRSCLNSYNDGDDRIGTEFTISEILNESQPPSVIYNISIIPFEQ